MAHRSLRANFLEFLVLAEHPSEEPPNVWEQHLETIRYIVHQMFGIMPNVRWPSFDLVGNNQTYACNFEPLYTQYTKRSAKDHQTFGELQTIIAAAPQFFSTYINPLPYPS